MARNFTVTRRQASFLLAVVLAILAALWAQTAQAASELANYLPKFSPATFFPDADRFGPVQ
ncbi:hypothetical protein SHY80_10970, partial [Streptococcus suis]|uniref:hypothetical protein n=1 Tax=Streptococcus suis TaxID=1307 RepID=UPI0029C1158F